ncbi:ligand-binding sensor domain-containing protein [Paenibacillus roseipurpureus]|uniref:Poly A polymerase head domain-containing protein n=1 Tax=Paenibacillus roseopurpureus TaxID=2918901 RepID=A0AA96LPU1_9BACL|nr:hypothetical protein [Paenibacillus sp. MBLB1832]WNR45102.1 hypothetical protein MJB10_02830 [Paenibacillus sp. MBLB1832]
MPNFALRDKFYELIEEWPLAKNVIYRLLEEGNLLLFGGSVRNYYENGFRTMPRDFDIVVCSDNDELDKYFYNIPYKKNRYGGYKIDHYSVNFDIWSLNSTWAFKTKKISNPNIENLTKTVFLNYDSVVYDLTTGRLYDEDYRLAKEKNKLDIVLQDNPFPELNVLRTFVFKTKHNMEYSERLRSYLVNWKEQNVKNALDLLTSIQLKHYGTEYLNKDQLIKELEII